MTIRERAGGRFTGIEVGRGVAASLVAFYHASRMLSEPRYSGYLAFDGGLSEFHVGVDFFFVLSGFLIAWIHWSDLGRQDRILRYFSRRFSRIYPAYWAVLFPLMAAHVFYPPVSHPIPMSPGNILASVFLLPSATPPFLGVAWTLVYEIFFYVLFGIVLLIGARGFGILLFWAAAIVIYNIVEGTAQDFPLSFFFGAYNLEFLLGIVLAAVLRRVTIPFPRTIAALGALVFLGFMLARIGAYFPGNALFMRCAFGIPSTLAILGVVEAERSGTLVIPRWLGGFGAASYAIYLVHSVAEPAVLALLWPHLHTLSAESLTILLGAVGLLAGILFHYLIERPLTRLVRNFPKSRAPLHG